MRPISIVAQILRKTLCFVSRAPIRFVRSVHLQLPIVLRAVQAGLIVRFAARRLCGRLEEYYAPGRDARVYRLAQSCALLGDTIKAMRYLQYALEQHESNLLVLGIDPIFASMHRDPRFGDLVARVGVSRKSSVGVGGRV